MNINYVFCRQKTLNKMSNIDFQKNLSCWAVLKTENLNQTKPSLSSRWTEAWTGWEDINLPGLWSWYGSIWCWHMDSYVVSRRTRLCSNRPVIAELCSVCVCVRAAVLWFLFSPVSVYNLLRSGPHPGRTGLFSSRRDAVRALGHFLSRPLSDRPILRHCFSTLVLWSHSNNSARKR